MKNSFIIRPIKKAAPSGATEGQTRLEVPRLREGHWQRISDAVTKEVRVQVAWSDPERATTGSVELWAWPRDLSLLAVGHVLLEVFPSGHSLHRNATVIEGPGGRIYRVILSGSNPAMPPAPPSELEAPVLLQAMREFITAEGQWDGTGCFHRAGVYAPAHGRLLTRAEDIGRHNCLDRLAGWSALACMPLTDKVLLTTARLTASLCAKALRAGFRVLLSRSAVTTASITLANEHNATLIGFARTDEDRLTVFADIPGRVTSRPDNALQEACGNRGAFPLEGA